ncbi:MAG: ATP-binding protein [Gammaproteobacteria bacterium]|nr:ATP-binding protein [Gammaproteobacteria bacterium]
MIFRNFRANVALRLLLLAVFVIVLAWSLVNTDWQLTPLVCGVLAVLLAIELIRYVESVNRELTSFLDFIAHDDFSASFPIAEKGRIFRRLEGTYKALARQYRRLNLEKEANHQYLESVVEHVSTALICLDDVGAVELMNRQAKALFKTPHLPNARSLARIDAQLSDLADRIDDGGRALVTVTIAGEPLQLALFATRFELLGRRYKLISFQNIRDELEQREIDFSQKLIRVLTHEIMNSVTPIISLSRVVEEALLEARCETASAEHGGTVDEDDLLRSVASIQSRGAGLLRFVQAYGTLTNLPRPNRASVDLGDLLEQVRTLVAPAVHDAGIALATRIGTPCPSIEADSEQLQQVLINLVNNAVDALAGRADGRITLSADRDARGRPVIRVTDNGPGIEPEHLDDIFVPFFTTKRHGTGVGLSVSRQILFLNRGLIAVDSAPGRGCEFSLRFR